VSATNNPTDRRQLLREALDAVERMQSKLDVAERVRHEPIAIVGMACRFPGGVNSPDDYWNLLRAGVDAVSEVPSERWTREACRRLDPKAGDAMPTQYGGFLRDVDRFDAQFFGISPREAATMDPQQRIVLETSWEALERAGVPADVLAGSLTGVFIGITTGDYAQVVRDADPTNLDVYFATGNAHNAAAGRVSYTLGLRGPAVAVDTACSSSLVATHLACQSLRLGESNLALAGGVNLILVPDPFVCFAKWGMMAPDGRCKTFDAAADGFVRAEGCGVLVLKRMSDALADGDRVLAVIRGSAVNQDGASGGLTVPNGLAQQAVIRQALAAARVEPGEVSYVETHGTGTSLGDPIELEAIDAVLGPGRPAGSSLVVGSVKTNIGHVESASGVAGLIKTVLSLQHREIPPHLHFKLLNPKINLRHLRVVVPTAMTPWVPSGARRVAGVSSFGFSGTNAHVVLEEAPERASTMRAGGGPERPAHLFTLSARSEPALRELAQRYRTHLEATENEALGDQCHASATTRMHHAHRAAVVAESRGQLAAALGAVAAGEGAARVFSGTAGGARPKVAFLFTGQGAQYVGMARALFETQPAFRNALERCCRLVDPFLDRPLLSVLYPDGAASSAIDETAYTQPVLFALEYALSEMWRTWGLVPDAVLGHSVGEFAAAVVAGVMSLEDGARLIATRGRLMQSLPAGGAMASVFCDLPRVEAALRPLGGRVSVAAINAPDSTVISGPDEAVQAVLSSLEADGIRSQRLVVSHAFHSPLMDSILESFEREASAATASAPAIDFVSNLSGRVLGPTDTIDAVYWRRHLREPVRFADGFRALIDRGCRLFVEIGPGSTLLGLGRRNEPAGKTVWVPSLRKDRGDWDQVLETLGRLYAEGVAVDWMAFDRPYGRERVALPTYPFQRTRHWVSPGAVRGTVGTKRGGRRDSGPFFDMHTTVAAEPPSDVWEGDISTSIFPFLADHVVQGRAVFPATGYVELVLEAATELFGQVPVALDRIQYQKPLFLAGDGTSRVQVTLTAAADGGMTFRVHSRSSDDPEPMQPSASWTPHVQGRVRVVEPSSAGLGQQDLDAILARCPEEVSGEMFYSRLAERGNSWGPSFQGVERLWRGQGEAIARVRVPAGLIGQIADFQFHPAVSDASGHALVATIPLERSDGPRGGAFVGGSIEQTCLYQRPRGRTLWAHARLREVAGEPSNVLVGDLRLFDEQLALVSELTGARLWYFGPHDAIAGQDVREWLYGLEFEPSVGAGPEKPARPIGPGAHRRTWLVLADTQGVGEALSVRLAADGDRCVLAFAGARFERSDDGSFRVPAGSRSDMERLLHAVFGVSESSGIGVVHLWSLDAPSGPGATAEDMKDGLATGLFGTLPLVQALSDGSFPEAPKLWLITRGAQAATAADRVDAVAASTLWGFGRTLAVESPDIWGALIDLDPGGAPTDAALAIGEELRQIDGEDQVAWRNGQRFAARVVRKACPAAPKPMKWRDDATYLITGGLGGLGLLFAGRMVREGARHLLLTARTPLPPREQWDSLPEGSKAAGQVAAIRALEREGALVFTAGVDVADASAMTGFLAEVRALAWPPIRGVIHAAGTVQYRAVRDSSVEDFAAACRAKVQGGWLLHQLLAGEPIDHFVCFSSASSVLGSPFVASYAAANAGLDALAHHRAHTGAVAVSVNWGLWAGLGMTGGMTADQLDAVSARGMGTIAPEAGLQAFDHAMAIGVPQVAVMPVDWRRWRELYPSFTDAPLLQHVAVAATARGGDSVRKAGPKTDLSTIDAASRPSLIASIVREQVEQVIGLSPKSLALDQPLTRMGLDSLMASELRSRVEAELGWAPPLVSLLEGLSVAELAAGLSERVEASLLARNASPGSSGAPGPGQELLTTVSGYSDDEVDAMLRNLLDADRERQ
jgi:acyl transferase domain-containing protein